MNGFYIAIKEFLEGKPVFNEDKGNFRLLCKTSDNQKIVFWGSPEDGTRNIDALKSQKLPVIVYLEPEDCIPSDYLRNKYNVTYSVNEHAFMSINPEI